MVPNIEKSNLNGGILFTDCQLSNSERFAIEIAHSAFEAGTHLANYVEAIHVINENNTVQGASVMDNLTGDKFEIRARVTVNASGPWLSWAGLARIIFQLSFIMVLLILGVI